MNLIQFAKNTNRDFSIHFFADAIFTLYYILRIRQLIKTEHCLFFYLYYLSLYTLLNTLPRIIAELLYVRPSNRKLAQEVIEQSKRMLQILV